MCSEETTTPSKKKKKKMKKQALTATVDSVAREESSWKEEVGPWYGTLA